MTTEAKRYPCEETTLDIRHSRYRVRLWITNNFGTRNTQAMKQLASDILSGILSSTGPNQQVSIAEIFAFGFPGLAAVQVIDMDDSSDVRTGHMIYTEPFDT